ncbi:hypothetical protein [Hymenobacter defluvii]|uniref:DUF3408 domain-containing protein n=1 Tax=Hymenobacter defluvii TaxID=2054411 RepID=A0ABS3THX8_9BACT|nr:hypothetical protein [Hymenobacter defluvii]MBO3273265.1 hypothetical protein [Hymenobacter defluvii]
MAKTFKQSIAKPAAQKRTSEKDILDFLEQEHPAESIPSTANKQKREDSNISNTTELVNSSNIDNTKLEAEVSIASVTDVTELIFDVRQTFVISQQYLDRLKDFVHTKRSNGQYEYTQKQALHDALDRLFAGTTIEERPAHIRQQEEKRKQQIRRGIPK